MNFTSRITQVGYKVGKYASCGVGSKRSLITEPFATTKKPSMTRVETIVHTCHESTIAYLFGGDNMMAKQKVDLEFVQRKCGRRSNMAAVTKVL